RTRVASSLLAAHRPPDEKQHQREHAPGFGEQDPGFVHAADSSPVKRRAPARPAWMLAAALLAGCAVAGPDPSRPVDQLPGWRDDTGAGLHEALARQCALPRPPAPWPALCAELPAAHALKDWIATRFAAWPLARDDGGPGLLTGYYE